MIRSSHRDMRDFSPEASQEESSSLRMDELEAQLSRVVEQEGMTISASRADLPRYMRRNRKRYQITAVTEGSARVVEVSVPEDRPIVGDEVRRSDLRLLDQLTVKRPNPVKKVTIRFAEHEPSAHFLELGGLAQKMDARVRENEGGSIQAWMAPSDEAIDLSLLAAAADDLYIQEVDPRLFVDQFTPGTAHHAYQASYGVFAKAKAPFVRWEVARAEPEAAPLDDLIMTPTESVASMEDPGNAPELPPIVTSHTFLERAAEIVHEAEERVDDVVQEVKDREEEMITSVERSWHVPVLVPKLQLSRVMLGFVALMLVVSLPAGAVSLSRSFGSSVHEVEAQSRLALSSLKEAVSFKGGLGGQDASWKEAQSRFQLAQQALDQSNGLALALAQALPNTRAQYQSVQSLLTAGKKATDAGQALNQGFTRALQVPGLSAGERVQIFSTYLDTAAPLLQEAMDALAQVQVDSLPEEVRVKVEPLQASLSQGREAVADLQSLTKFFVAALGSSQARNYLLVFQNHTELRPTGGFMGSLAEVTLDKGELASVRVPGGGPYELQGQLLERVQAPKPIQLVSSRWEFQDANWFPDFPTSAEKIRWFWSKSGQNTVDGVIAVNATLMEKILRVTGPIDMPEYGKTITADNFLLETQKAVELEYDKEENKPKKIIGDLMPKVLDRVKQASQEDWLKLLDVGVEALQTKEIQVAMTRENEQSLMEKMGWTGSMADSKGDYLSLIEANIAGQKTDGVINETVGHDVKIAEDGSITATVTLKREHTGGKGELFRGVNNVSYLRLYVPLGSELLAVDGLQPPGDDLFEKPATTDKPDVDLARIVTRERPGVGGTTVTDEFGKTVFGGWIQLGPGQTKETKFTYRLPFTAFDIARQFEATSETETEKHAAYFAMYGSQSGKPNRSIETRVTMPASWKSAWNNVTSTEALRVWDRDRVYASLLDVPTSQP